MYTIVPLGNPGKQYERTRHNAARVVLEYMKLTSPHVEVFTPTTYMNESGPAVYEYLRYHENRSLIVMYDDKDLPLGTIRISFDRGDGGHNGLKSIIQSIGTTSFIRLRIGVGPKEMEVDRSLTPHGEDVQKYVLSNFSEEEMVELQKLADRITLAIEEIIAHGYQKAMERFN
jgi:PTH1 family peptidyl-tRNA hydrolase